MTVAELIAKLSSLPPSTVVATDGEFGYAPDPEVYVFAAHVDRRDDGAPSWIQDDNGRDSTELVALVTHFGHDDDKRRL
ncbi:hypothetical protein SEA_KAPPAFARMDELTA_75 [Gordonia phage KappaFarmDelta]|nr:hypothetical protein SEA_KAPPAFARMDELTA_75 [Gordonia phage KappaFarmDelta]